MELESLRLEFPPKNADCTNLEIIECSNLENSTQTNTENRNSEQHKIATQKTQTDRPKKKKTQNINLENTNPQQKIFHQRTNLEKIENESRDKPNQKTNLWCRDQ